MADKDKYTLKVDPQFQDLIAPLNEAEFHRLERAIVSQGCKDPIITWEGSIADGHKRYAICSKHQIPFEVKKADFECREVVIAWICLNQLTRTDLTEEMRHYLIGQQYESERAAYWNSHSLVNSHSEKNEPLSRTAVRRLISGRIAEENSISRGTVEKYARYARSLDAIRAKHPELAFKILQGQYKISHNNIEELAKLSAADLRRVQYRIEQMQEQDSVKFYQIRSILNNNIVKKQSRNILAGTSVKDMPAFDPDAEIVGLTLTIPTWIRSVDRVLDKSDLSIVSRKAKHNLNRNAAELIIHLQRLISAIEEK